MADASPATLGVYKPRRPQASPLFRLVSDHLQRLQTVYDERFAREYGPWRPVVAQVVDKCSVAKVSLALLTFFNGSPGWVRSSACIWLFSSKTKTTARSGGWR